MILKSHERFDFYFDFTAQKEFEEKEILNTNGWYKFIDGVLTALFQEGDKWCLVYNAQKISIVEQYSSQIKKLDNKGNYLFQLLNLKSVVVEFVYNFDKSILYEDDTTGFIEREDFDWGLFLQNRIGEP